MHIRMLKSFTYPLETPGVTRTLPQGQTFNEDLVIAEYAIANGFAEELVPPRPVPVVLSEEIDDWTKVEDGAAGSDETTTVLGTSASPATPIEPTLAPEPDPAPETAAADAEVAEAAPTSRRGKKAAGDDVAPAEAVDPA